MKTAALFLFLLSWGVSASAADRLTASPRKMPEPGEKAEFRMLLDKPADSVSIELKFYSSRFYLNGKNIIVLKGSGTDFSKTLTYESAFNMYLSSQKRYGSGLTATPFVTRDGKTEKLKPVPLWSGIFFPDALLKYGNVQSSYGKFGKGILFDGSSFAVSNGIEFCPEKGTLEVWLYLAPGMRASGESTVIDIQSEGSKWTYQRLLVTKARRVQYLVYNGKQSRAISSDAIARDDWIHVAMTWDLATEKMELYLDGKLCGKQTYDLPAGFQKSKLSLGGIMKNTKNSGCMLINPATVMLDDLRITDQPFSGRVPDKALVRDAGTLLLLDFDSSGFLRGRNEK